MADASPTEDKPKKVVSIWPIINGLANRYDATNLGQGFPNWPAPDFVKEAAVEAVNADLNQYTNSQGHPHLVDTLCGVFSDSFGRQLGRENVTVSVGGCEALFGALMSLVSPGKNVVLLEPAFDCYDKQVAMAGGTCRYVPVRAPEGAADGEPIAANDFVVDMAEFEAAIDENTVAFVLNTPHNPLGKIFSVAELEAFAAIAIKHDLVCIADEVYEWIVYDGLSHNRMATIDGMWDRTITVGSGGKTFSVTGWKIGWAIGPKHLVTDVYLARQWTSFSVATPLQEAVAVAFEATALAAEGEPHAAYFDEYKADLQERRDKLVTYLSAAGLRPVVPSGSYFVLCDISGLGVDLSDGGRLEADDIDDADSPDTKFCKWIIANVGVAAIPCSAFYSDEHKPLAANLVRFCFCKTNDVLDTAGEKLSKLADM